MYFNPAKLLVASAFLKGAFCITKFYAGKGFSGPSKTLAEDGSCQNVPSDWNDFSSSLSFQWEYEWNVYFKDNGCKSSYLLVPNGHAALNDLGYYGFDRQISSYSADDNLGRYPCQYACGDLCCGNA